MSTSPSCSGLSVAPLHWPLSPHNLQEHCPKGPQIPGHTSSLLDSELEAQWQRTHTPCTCFADTCAVLLHSVKGCKTKQKAGTWWRQGDQGIGTCPENLAMVLDRGMHWKPIRNVRALRNHLPAFLRSLTSQHTRLMGKEPKALGFQPHCHWTSP